ncbi:Uncharacterised protein [Nocardia cyriacigeorgica]|uniref:Uncharacterized protein n=1 Tax=Nocardia cyriacigeorgica TaxID=135487 RepID=A0A4U8W6Z3_9NOCA|nr:Uncharacterised protein [Nocardia cyriacigeorgica]
MRVAEGVVGACADDGQARVDGAQEFGCGGAGTVVGDLEDVGAEGRTGTQQGALSRGLDIAGEQDAPSGRMRDEDDRAIVGGIRIQWTRAG